MKTYRAYSRPPQKPTSLPKCNYDFRRIWKGIIKTIAVILFASPICGQGTIEFGFEEFQIDSTPPFVAQSPGGYIGWRPAAADSTLSAIPPFEGQKLLRGINSILIEAPNGQPIQSFSLQLFIEPPFGQPAFGISGQGTFVPQYGVWQRFEADLDAPIQKISLGGFQIAAAESYPLYFSIDSVQLVTIPEPRSSWLFILGFGAIVFHQKFRRLPARKFTPAKCEPF